MNEHLIPGPDCIALIQQSEGFRSRPYLCLAGVPTIGYGSTRHADGTPVTLRDAPITQAQAQALLLATLAPYADAVRRRVRVPLTQSQFDALTSFVYNIGDEQFRLSTLLVLLNRGEIAGAAEQFGRWTRSAGRVLLGLVKRRAAERRLFMRGV